MPKTLTDDSLLRGLVAISRDGLDGEISARALSNMVERKYILIEKVAGRYTSTRRRIRQQFEALMDGERGRR
jgi:hypothetical protein